ncbi:hypothetical protein L1887_10815 [Cichorium endivia]|nr:hypothetical protein L1887_10815 [Cichorium endivia]
MGEVGISRKEDSHQQKKICSTFTLLTLYALLTNKHFTHNTKTAPHSLGRLSSFEKPKSRVLSSSSFRARRLRKQRMGHSNIWNSHPKTYGPGSRLCRVCGNSHGLIRKYGLMCCRQCFHSNAKEIGFIKYR